MDSLGLPQKNDYPEGLNILNDPHSKYYAGAVEASASAYFSSSTLIKKLFYKRLETTIAFLTNSFPTNSFPTTPFLKYNNILDAGTGIGILLPFLSKISRKVKAIDYSDIINYAEAMCLKNKIKNVSFEKTDLLKLNTNLNPNLKKDLKKNPKYDLIICLSVLEHINDVDCVLKKFSQILNPGGTLIVGYPIEYKVTKVIRLLESAFRNDLSSKIVQNSYKKTEEFAGHISGWKKIDLALSNNFHVDKKVDLKFCFMKYYALRKAYKKQ